MERSLIFWWSSDILICASLILLWVLMLFLSRSSTVSYTVSPAEEETLPLKTVTRDTTQNCKISWEGDPFHVYFVIFLVDKISSQILSYREIIHVTSNTTKKTPIIARMELQICGPKSLLFLGPYSYRFCSHGNLWQGPQWLLTYL